MTKNPRPHTELIKAWADGADIQYLQPKTGKWIDSPEPAWVTDYEYRVKPQHEYPEILLTQRDLDLAWSKLARGEKPILQEFADFVMRHAIDNGQVVTREEFALAIGDRDKRDMAVAKEVASGICRALKLRVDHKFDEEYLRPAIARVGK